MRKVYSILFILFVFSFAYCISSYDSGKTLTSQGIDIKKEIGLKDSEYKEFTGKGVTVAIVDSGVQFHKDFNKEKVIYFKDFVNERSESYDDLGHGTAIAGIIGANGGYKGIAPDTKFVIIKAVDNNGIVYPDKLYKALDWLVENKNKYNINIVNISIGLPTTLSSEQDPLFKIIDDLKKQGVMIICSAGNNGPEEGTILSPGSIEHVLTIGSINNNRTSSLKDDKVTLFSSRGLINSSKIKPDMVTFGVGIDTLDYLDQEKYTTSSGTSFSSAIVAGVAAVMIEKYKNETTDSIENLLLNSVYRIDDDFVSQGNGELILKQR